MRFRIRHTTLYRYEHPVTLGPHVFRQQPRADASLRLDGHRLNLYPRPRAMESLIDPEGNPVTSAAFEGTTQEFRVAVESVGETFARGAPVLDARAAAWPPRYEDAPDVPSPAALAAWRRTDAVGESVAAFADGVAAQAGPSSLARLDALSLTLHERLRDVPRLTGAPHDPEFTLRAGKGSCRDFAVLYVACSRHLGFAARFVSGYLPAAPGERQHMHAWAEVLLPGAGWIPYDPTRGGRAGEEHIPVAAAAEAADAAPLTGTYAGAGRSEMIVELTVEVGESRMNAQ